MWPMGQDGERSWKCRSYTGGDFSCESKCSGAKPHTRMSALGEFGKSLQHIVNATVYGQ